jgi:catechol 2,3-dioxygenase-like lactoylglutathione lyase family enzyme
MGLFNHLGFTCSNGEVSKAFYDAALAPLGVKVLTTIPTPNGPVYGYGQDRPVFWFAADGLPTKNSLHVAFSAETRDQVHAFYQAALAAGGKDNGGPGLREHYAPGYYAAFVHDPDGNNIEAVTFAEG